MTIAVTPVLLETTFEWVELLMSLTGPIALALIGLFIHRATNRIEQKQWTNQKVIEKRLQLFDQMAPKLNRVYCYMTWRGRWKEFSPVEIIEAKRELDEIFHVHRFLLSADVRDAYNRFIDACYLTNWSANRDALLLTTVRSNMGDRDSAYTKSSWNEDWEQFLLSDGILRNPVVVALLAERGHQTNDPDPAVDVEWQVRKTLRPAYDHLMNAFSRDLEQVQESKKQSKR